MSAESTSSHAGEHLNSRSNRCDVQSKHFQLGGDLFRTPLYRNYPQDDNLLDYLWDARYALASGASVPHVLAVVSISLEHV